MPRSPASEAERQLIAQVAEMGVTVTVTQLERWRACGLAPRPTVRRLGARGSTASYPPGSAERVAVIGQLSRRGRPYATVAFLMFLKEFDVPAGLLVDGVRSLVSRLAGTVERERSKVRAQLGEGDHDLLDEAEAIARMVIAGRGPAAVRARRNLRRHSLAEVNPQNLEAVVEGALATTFRIVTGDVPESEDSLREAIVAVGGGGALIPAADGIDPILTDLTEWGSLFRGFSLDACMRLAHALSAEHLALARQIFLPMYRVLVGLPAEARSAVGLSDLPVGTDDPEVLAALLVAAIRFWLLGPAEPRPLLSALCDLHLITASVAEDVAAASDLLIQNRGALLPALGLIS